ncbi:TPA: hypothetical protein JD037_02825 [Raoultella ornithinolytica]|nr:hypothetical protein [Raoultella ornithinolytica]
MNAKNPSHAHYIYNELKEPKRLKVILGSGDGVGITIQSTFQDKAFLDAMYQHVVVELYRCIEEKKATPEDLEISFS